MQRLCQYFEQDVALSVCVCEAEYCSSKGLGCLPLNNAECGTHIDFLAGLFLFKLLIVLDFGASISLTGRSLGFSQKFHHIQ